ncbi:unnamed protein product [Cyberlindnera jadinii]|uniref:Uncharacterized protein n=1 Tax=Cyberlindnera jadinii (strain ATCC 18201 / CBS 1600 / BCRC 20928 / JCM 3617 / NBRC 0987 / NRRL Y-1542) TaxID=983966 RepID=A0A0H5C7X7_CYBJN|nr:unnamed protein product [Cyberlindnera jadinii]
MSIRLPDDEENLESHNDNDTQSVLSYNTRLKRTVSYRIIKYLSQFKFCYIPVLNWLILFFYLSMLYKLIQKYESMYSQNVLITTITTNVLLFGLSDTLAQSISCVVEMISRDNQRHNVSFSTLPMDNYHHHHNHGQGVDQTPDDSFYADYGDTTTRRNRQNSLQSITSMTYQSLSEQTDKDVFNFRRFVGFSCWGFFMAFIQVVWYWVLNHMFTTDPTFVSVLERVLSDQLFFSPISLFSFFSYSNFVLEGGDKVTLNDKIQKIYLSTLAANWMVWPLVQFINFLVMPRRFQVPFSSSGELYAFSSNLVPMY